MPDRFLYMTTVLFQTIQFSICTVFFYTQLNVKTDLFQTVPFYISTLVSSIQAIDRTQSGATTSSQSGTIAIKLYFSFPKAPASLKPHHQII